MRPNRARASSTALKQAARFDTFNNILQELVEQPKETPFQFAKLKTTDYATSNITNYSSAYGNIMNADMAEETANLASAQIQRDAATAMLAQSHTMNKELVAYLLKSVVA